MKIGITGGIGSGKSTAAKIIQEQGFPVYSCDEIYREITARTDYICTIEKLFPGSTENGKIIKKKLADIVFNDKDALNLLNGIAHPLVMEELEKRLKKENNRIAFVEIPLLFEGHYEAFFDKILVILRNRESRIQAIINRDHIDRISAVKTIENQYNYDLFSEASEKEGKKKLVLIQNDASFGCLENEIKKFLTSITSRN